MSSGTNRRISFYFRRENKQDTIVEESATKVVEAKVVLKDLRVELNKLTKDVLVESKLPKKGNPEPQAVRRSARNLPPELKEKIEKPHKKDIQNLKSIEFKGKIKYAEDFYTCAENCDEILQNIEKCTTEIVPVGFDLEWPFSFQTGSGKTALAQVCMSEKVCYLFHLFKLTKLPAAFTILLSHPKVRLVGVNIKNDIWKLGRDFKDFPAAKVVENNCLDCGVHYNSAVTSSGRWSLERLTAHLLSRKIDKNPSVRRSRWHILPLSSAQKQYAATDAYVSWLLHLKINEKAIEVAKENEEREERKRQQLESGNITEPELFAIR